ncbi:MAG TPA: hypothetical protein VLW53_20705, partial [Candidatus Eisenbacteria bacterium]|nr:hypothetical protein [Candidatus Eisenbacteria bacterium]
MLQPHDRRAFLGRGVRLAAAGLLLPGAAEAVLGACTASGAAPEAPVSPRRGGSLTFATEAEINSFDPRQGAWDS